jgi:hypothetical protein
MEQRLFITISRWNNLHCTQIHIKSFKLSGDDVPSYSEMCCCSRQFFMAGSMSKMQEALTDAPISVFSFKFRVHLMRCHLPLFNALPRLRTLLQ